MDSLRLVLAGIQKKSPITYWIILFHLFVALGCILGLFIDDRFLVGANVWIKPLKFAISGGIYLITVAHLTTLYPYSNRKKKIIDYSVAITLGIDMVIIALQATRGVQSHYNMNSAFDGILFALMGIFVGYNVLIMFLFIIDTIRLKMTVAKSVQWAILLGWVVVVIGSWVGGKMIGQMAHNVGVADGGTGLPLVNWSTVGGDLRVAHFFGLHGIQIIPLFALWLSNKWKGGDRNQIIATTSFALLYAGWIGFTFYQAKQGIPFINL